MDPPKRKEALDLMKKAADLLMNSEEKKSDTGNRPGTSSFSPVSSELRRLFKPYTSTGNRAQRQTMKGKIYWTHRFVCLGEKDQERIPSREERKYLFEAGLGEKKITFEKTDDCKYFTDTIEDTYPKLRGCGGWELLRTPGSSRSELTVIKPSKNGYSSVYLGESYLGQAVCYIRPIQEDLDMSAMEYSEEETVKETCKICKKDVSLMMLREHVNMCREKREKNPDDGLPEIRIKKRKMQPICSFICQSETENSTEMSIKTNNKLSCPVCKGEFDENKIEVHAATCGDSLINDQVTENVLEELNLESIQELDEISHREKSMKETLNEMSDVKDADLIIECYQRKYLRGRQLDASDEYSVAEGKTLELFVCRESMLDDGLSELRQGGDVSFPLDINFFGEEAVDLGGPRREFLSACLHQICDRFILDGVLLTEEQIGKEAYLRYVKNQAFEMAGLLIGLSLLQGGPVPAIFSEPEKLFFSPSTKIEVDFINGLERLGLKQLCSAKKEILSLFDKNNQKENVLTYPKLVKLLAVSFSEEGSNARNKEIAVYRLFLDYLKELAAHRRGNLSLESVLQFVTGSGEVPLLGYKFKPSICFQEVESSLPTSSTCLCKLFLPINDNHQSKEQIFDYFDLAFANSYFGLV